MALVLVLGLAGCAVSPHLGGISKADFASEVALTLAPVAVAIAVAAAPPSPQPVAAIPFTASQPTSIESQPKSAPTSIISSLGGANDPRPRGNSAPRLRPPATANLEEKPVQSNKPSLGSAVVFGPDTLYTKQNSQKLYLRVADGQPIEELTKELEDILKEKRIAAKVLPVKDTSKVYTTAESGGINRFINIPWDADLRADLKSYSPLIVITPSPEQINGKPKPTGQEGRFMWDWTVKAMDGAENLEAPELRLDIWISKTNSPEDRSATRDMSIPMKVKVSNNLWTQWFASFDGATKIITERFYLLTALVTSVVALVAAIVLLTRRGRAAGRYFFALFRSR